MKYVLWIVQVLLALIFGAAGLTKVFTPYNGLIEMQPWVESFSTIPWVIVVIGGLEVLGAIGLLLPSITRILPKLTPLAGVGLALTMVGAIILHIIRAEWEALIPNIIFLILAIFVAYGRYKILPIAPRTEATTLG